MVMTFRGAMETNGRDGGGCGAGVAITPLGTLRLPGGCARGSERPLGEWDVFFSFVPISYP